MGANTYRLMSGFAAGEPPAGQDEFAADEEASVDELTRAAKVVFSASLEAPLAWANSTLVRDDAIEAVRALKDGRLGSPEHDRQPQLVPVTAASRTRRSVPRRDVPGDHRRHGSRAHLRRLSRRRLGDDRHPHVRREHPARRVPAQRARAPTARNHDRLSDRLRQIPRRIRRSRMVDGASTGRGYQAVALEALCASAESRSSFPRHSAIRSPRLAGAGHSHHWLSARFWLTQIERAREATVLSSAAGPASRRKRAARCGD